MPLSTGPVPKARSGGLLRAYRLGGRLARPVLPLLLSWRAGRGKEDTERLSERRGEASLPRPEGPLVWVHAASVGETNAVLPLVSRIVASGPRVLFTTVTTTSASIAGGRLPKGAFHQYVPVDIAPWTARFLDHWKPDLALFTESELWPGLMAGLAERRVPLALVNARLSAGSFARWRRLGNAARSMFGQVSLCLAQGAEHAERYRAVGVGDVVVTGNIKFDVPAPAADAAALAELRERTAGRLLWVAASTHEGEEVLAAAVHQELRRQFPSLLTIVIPRHPPRGRVVAETLREAGLHVAVRSVGEPLGADVDVYLADTLGELGLFYRLAPIAFVGGSLIPHGGQNPIEPVKLGAAVLHGPHVANFLEVYAALDAADARSLVADEAGLSAALMRLLADPLLQRESADRAATALRPYSGALEATLEALQPYLAPLSAAATLRPLL